MNRHAHDGRLSRRELLRGVSLAGAALGIGGAELERLVRAGQVIAAGDTLVVAQDTSVQTFDPQIVYDNTVRITRGVYETLVALDGSTPRIVPRLATAWTAAPDVRQWTLTLRLVRVERCVSPSHCASRCQ